jgi:hypothetical protein
VKCECLKIATLSNESGCQVYWVIQPRNHTNVQDVFNFMEKNYLRSNVGTLPGRVTVKYNKTDLFWSFKINKYLKLHRNNIFVTCRCTVHCLNKSIYILILFGTWISTEWDYR